MYVCGFDFAELEASSTAGQCTLLAHRVLSQFSEVVEFFKNTTSVTFKARMAGP